MSSCLPILTSRLSCFPQSSSYLLLSLPPFLSFIVSLHFTPCIIYPSLHSVVFFISLFFSHYPMLPLYLPIRPLLRNEISLMIMECVILINFILCCFLKHPIDGAVAHDWKSSVIAPAPFLFCWRQNLYLPFSSFTVGLIVPCASNKDWTNDLTLIMLFSLKSPSPRNYKNTTHYKKVYSWSALHLPFKWTDDPKKYLCQITETHYTSVLETIFYLYPLSDFYLEEFHFKSIIWSYKCSHNFKFLKSRGINASFDFILPYHLQGLWLN